MTQSITLPVPDDFAQQCSRELMAIIKAEINASPQGICFADYMRCCLYYPGLGYYSAGSHKLGQGGDFTTAPEISPLFSEAVSHHVADALVQCSQRDVLEFGAGSGKMAVAMLQELQRLDCLPTHYFILEASADLQERQQEYIASEIPELIDHVTWLAALPDTFEGVMVANEVCDAMPVHLLHFTHDSVFERGVTLEDDQLRWYDLPLASQHLQVRADEIRQLIGQQEYIAEINLAAESWLQTLAQILQRGAIFIMDYGYPRNQYYHPQRNSGSLMCYYRHQGHDNPFIYPGLQDITAHIDFTALAKTAVESGLSVAGFHTQADFLVAGDITQLAAEEIGQQSFADLEKATALKRLLLPQHMGETFKVLTLSIGLDSMPRLLFNDRRHQL